MGDHEHRSRSRKQDAASAPTPSVAPGKQTLAPANAEYGQQSAGPYKGSLFGSKTPWSANDSTEQHDDSGAELAATVRALEFSFVWFNEAAQAELEKLRRDIRLR